jgi:hypothetical protein
MQDAFETLNAAMAKVRETGWVEFQWPLYEPRLHVTLELNGHIAFIWLRQDGDEGRDIGAGELIKLMDSAE